MKACAICGQPLDEQTQVGWRGNLIPLVTCWNEACALRGYTFAVPDYAELRLEDYLQVKRDSQ